MCRDQPDNYRIAELDRQKSDRYALHALLSNKQSAIECNIQESDAYTFGMMLHEVYIAKPDWTVDICD